jgi:hypothetical protein
MTHGIFTLGMTTLGKMTLGIMTLGIMPLGIMALDFVCPHAELPVHWLFMMLILLSLCRVFL